MQLKLLIYPLWFVIIDMLVAGVLLHLRQNPKTSKHISNDDTRAIQVQGINVCDVEL